MWRNRGHDFRIFHPRRDEREIDLRRSVRYSSDAGERRYAFADPNLRNRMIIATCTDKATGVEGIN
jgi:hypothetical protein